MNIEYSILYSATEQCAFIMNVWLSLGCYSNDVELWDIVRSQKTHQRHKFSHTSSSLPPDLHNGRAQRKFHKFHLSIRRYPHHDPLGTMVLRFVRLRYPSTANRQRTMPFAELNPACMNPSSTSANFALLLDRQIRTFEY